MLKARVLNSNATLNQFHEIGTLSFIPGYGITLVLQLYQPQNGLRYMSAAGATLIASFQKSDGEFEEVSMSAMVGDSSIWSTALTAEQTENLVGGNFTFELTEGETVTKGWVESGTEVIITGAC